ncbi:hypothetical protein H0E87_026221, partial [Populus deltoides]
FPNLVGIPLGILQLVLYCKYRKRGIKEESHKWDLEIRNEEKSKQLQLVINDRCISLRIIFLNFREAVRAAEVKKKCALAVTDVYDI